jgi:predicted signal transduction protein with EAL and GGDEF domain
MAKRLTSRLRETDTVARLGGDEFAVVIENLAKPEHAALVARKLLDTVVPPLEIDGETVTVTASLGLALYPKDSQDAASLIREADRAMYRAKAEGGNLCRFASDQMERRVQRGALMVSDLRRGLEAGEFVLHYQPQVTLTPGTVGISAMIRWNHPELGLIGSERFLPLAEDHGLLEPLAAWLFEAACAQVGRWREEGMGRLHLALPLLSRQQLAWSALPEHLASALGRGALDPGWLEIELTEEMLLADADAGGAGVAGLGRLGVRLALDGFGRGPTSLRSLQLGVLDTLKLARELHRRVPEDRRRAAVLASLASLARELGLRIVAEGVDSHEQLAFLRRCGCDAVQAFMSCPPLPAEACTGWLKLAATRRDGGPGELPFRLTGPCSLDGAAHPSSLGTASPDRRLTASGGRSPG